MDEMLSSNEDSAANETHEVERIFVSDRGLHVCFKTEEQAKKAYASATAVGRSSILEGTQVIEPQIHPARDASEGQ